MKRDYDWLMMVMGKLMRQCDRGLISRKEFNDELWFVVNSHRRWVMEDIGISITDIPKGATVVFFVDFGTRELYATVDGKRQKGTYLSANSSIPEMEAARKHMQEQFDNN